SGNHFALGENLVLCEKVDVLLRNKGWESIGCGSEIQQTSALRFFNPFLRIVVAVEDNSLVVLQNFLDNVVKNCVKVLSTFKFVCKACKLFCYDCVKHNVWSGD